MEYFILAIR